MTEPDDLMPIEQAGSRTRLEHHAHARAQRNGLLAVLGLLVLGSLVIWAIYRFVNA